MLDNAYIIGEDPRIRQATAQNVFSILEGGYRYNNPDVGLYRPLTTFSYMVNYAVFGNDSRPAGYHWVNLALHCVNVALVYALGIAVFAETAPAWALAAIWGLHPLLTESVTNIVGRADLLAAFGVLAGLLCDAKAASAAGRGRLAWLAGLMGAQAIGIFSKESAVVLPGLMLLYDLTWIDRITWRTRAYAYAVLALPLSAFFYLRGQLHAHMLIPFADNPLVSADFWTARLTAIKVIGDFLGLFLWPAEFTSPAAADARSNGLRELPFTWTGRASTITLETVVSTRAFSVWSTCAEAVISMLCCAVPTSSLTTTRASPPGLTVTPSAVNDLKPVTRTLT